MRDLRAHLLCECFFLRNLLTSPVMLSDLPRKWLLARLLSVVCPRCNNEPYALFSRTTHALKLICFVMTSLFYYVSKNSTLALFLRLIIRQHDGGCFTTISFSPYPPPPLHEVIAALFSSCKRRLC
jgi:hypothetical protein